MLSWGDCPGNHGGPYKTEAGDLEENRAWKMLRCSSEDGRKVPRAGRCKLAKARTGILPQREPALLTPAATVQAADLWSHKMLSSCCFKPLRL